MTMLGNLALLRYVKSFSEGRVRIRHPALRNAEVAARAREGIGAIKGVSSVECNPVSGSVLILYDSEAIPKDKLISVGVAWAGYLDAIQAGRSEPVPTF